MKLTELVAAIYFKNRPGALATGGEPGTSCLHSFSVHSATEQSKHPYGVKILHLIQQNRRQRVKLERKENPRSLKIDEFFSFRIFFFQSEVSWRLQQQKKVSLGKINLMKQFLFGRKVKQNNQKNLVYKLYHKNTAALNELM